MKKTGVLNPGLYYIYTITQRTAAVKHNPITGICLPMLEDCLHYLFS